MSSAEEYPQGVNSRHEGTDGQRGSGHTRHVVAQQRERFGGMKFGACFFGWLAATGTTVLLTALVAAVGAGVGISRDVATGPGGADASLIGAITVLVIIFVGYVAGGYVAGRMARFNGAKQGVGVWLWAIIVAVVVAVLSLIAGTQVNVLSSLASVIPLPAGNEALTTGTIVTAVLVVVVALAGAVVGGLAGMRYHRRIDRATHDPVP